MTVSNTQTLGTLNGTALVVDIGAGYGSDAVGTVTLSKTWVPARPAGTPVSPDQTGSEVARKTSSYGSGTVLSTFSAVTKAIKAAGGGS